MEIIKIIGVGLISLMVILILKQYKPEFTIYISLIAGCIILFMVLNKLIGIISLLTNLSSKIGFGNEFLKILIKITGIAILSEFAINLCKDCGESAIANKIELGGKIIIVSISIPIITALLEIVLQILP